MADKDEKKKGQLRDPDTGKFLGKYDTEEDAVKGYSELERKFGEQGKQYGDTRKQYEQMTAEIEKYKTWAKEAAPIVEWYSKFNQPISQWWQQYNTQGTMQQGSNGQYGMNQMGQQPQMQQQAWGQAANMVANSPGAELLTAQEKQALVQQTAQHLIQQSLGPWTQNLAKTLETWGESRAKQMNDQMEQRLKAFSNVHWQTLQRLVPPEKLQEARAWHDEALKYADPSKINPLEVASETLEAKGRISRLEAELATANKAREKYEKDSMGSLGNGGGLYSQPSDIKEMPKSRDDRFKNVMSTVKEAVGVEGVRDAFPAL